MSTDHAEDDALAGDPVVYDGGWVSVLYPSSSLQPIKPLQAKAESPEHDRGTAMIRERISTHGVVRPLEPEPELPALHIDSVHLGIISARWAQVYLAKVYHHEKKYAGTMRQIARRRERAIALLRSQGSGGGGDVEGEGWSVAWALGDADERPPPSSLVARCDTTEALALARAAAATKRKRNARLAAAASVSGTHKRRTQDGEEKGKKAARSRPAESFGGG
jgi:hypothetical protein